MNRTELELEILKKIRRREKKYNYIPLDSLMKEIKRYKRVLKILESVKEKEVPLIAKTYEKWVKR